MTTDLSAVIKEALQATRATPSWQPAEKRGQHQKGVIEQNEIGWIHIYFGRFSTELSRASNNTAANGSKHCTQWSKQLLKTIWNTMLELWRQRNELVHGTTMETKKSQQRKALIQRVVKCYSMRGTLQLSDQLRLYQKEQEEMMLEDPFTIKAWVRTVERIIRTNKREATGNQQQKRMMDQYFKWHPPEKVTSRKPKSRTQHHKQDLRPD